MPRIEHVIPRVPRVRGDEPRPVEHSVRSVFHVGVEALMDRRRYRVIRGRLNDR